MSRKSKPAVKRLRVLVVAPSLDILGGQAVQAVRLLNFLAREPSLEADCLPVNPRLPEPFRWLQRVKYLRTIATWVPYVLSLLRRAPGYDILHIFSASYWSFVLAPTPAILIAKLYGKRSILNYRSGEAEDHLRRWRTAVPTIRLVDALVAPSGYLVDVFRQFNLQAHCIPNVVRFDQVRFRKRQPLRPVFLSNRNFQPLYDVGNTLRAFALIQQRYSDARLIVVGDGRQRRELEILTQQLNLRHTQFVGPLRPEMMGEMYDAADIYLNSSQIDNMPVSILEAFACGLPVVTTNAGGIPYILTHEVTGLMVNCGDHEGMAAAVMRLLEDESLAATLIENARQQCQKYSWGAVRQQWLALYQELRSSR